MKWYNKLLATMMAMLSIVVIYSCEEEPEVTPPANPPTIGIHEPSFDKESMTLTVLIAPSTDAAAWYWKIEAQGEKLDYTKVEGAAADELQRTVEYGIEYTISAYAENEGGKSEVDTKKFCPMPDAAVVAIGEVTLNEESMQAEATVYPSASTTKWYWKATAEGAEDAEWQAVDGNSETIIRFDYQWGVKYEIRAYAENISGKSEEATAEAYFEPEAATIEVGEAQFDEESMTLSFEVTPSATTHRWYWGEHSDAETEQYEHFEDNKARTVSCTIEYDKEYNFIFVAENIVGNGEQKSVVVKYDMPILEPLVSLSIKQLTAFTISVEVSMAGHCKHYAAGAMMSTNYDKERFVTQALASLNPDANYPFMPYNTATESRTFTEQDLERGSLATAESSSGIVLHQQVEYTIAVYAEDANGRNDVYTLTTVIPAATIGEDFGLTLTQSDEQIGQTWAKASVEAPAGSKLLVGYLDYTSSSAEQSFSFEGKSDEECKAYILSAANALPKPVSEDKEYLLSENLNIDTKYVAYAIAISEAGTINICYKVFTTKSPSLSGIAKIEDAYIYSQSSVDELDITLYTDDNATKVRLYAAPATDHAAYADHMVQIMDASDYQNFREEYDVSSNMAAITIDIHHPGDDYYMYAVAIDGEGKAGEMVNVAQLSGLSTEYYTTAKTIDNGGGDDIGGGGDIGGGDEPEPDPEPKPDPINDPPFDGTTSVTLTASDVQITPYIDEERISVTLRISNPTGEIDQMWLYRLGGCKREEIAVNIREKFADYPTLYGSRKVAELDTDYRYENTNVDSFNPKIESLLPYDNTHGGDIIVVVLRQPDGKFNIPACFIPGIGVQEL